MIYDSSGTDDDRVLRALVHNEMCYLICMYAHTNICTLYYKTRVSWDQKQIMGYNVEVQMMAM